MSWRRLKYSDSSGNPQTSRALRKDVHMFWKNRFDPPSSTCKITQKNDTRKTLYHFPRKLKFTNQGLFDRTVITWRMISEAKHLSGFKAYLVLHRNSKVVEKTVVYQGGGGGHILWYKWWEWDHPATDGCTTTLIWLNTWMCTVVGAWHCIHKTLA